MAERIKKFLDQSLEILVMIAFGVLVIDVLWQVFTRYVLNHPSSWTEELAIFLLIWVALLGAAVALGRGAHLGIDYFVNKLPPRTHVLVDVFIFLCVALFSFLVMILGGIELVKVTLALQQKSPALGIDMGYVYLAVPISGFFMVLYSVLELIGRVRLFMKGPEALKEYKPEHEIPEDVD